MKTKEILMEFSSSIVIMIIIYIIFTELPEFINTYFNIVNNYLTLFSAILIGSISITLYTYFKRTYQNPKLHRVAVLGFPRSGKTSLIVSLFSEAFARKLQIRMVPKGNSTIEKINESLEMLGKGLALGPTGDQDMFSFWADITKKQFPFTISYKALFGDFSGNDSEKYINDNYQWLHKSEFFKWVSDSDALIFVIDVGRYLLNPNLKRNYVAKISSAFRAAWQSYLDINEYKINEVKKHPVLIIFNKMDLFGRLSKDESFNLYSEFENSDFDNIIIDEKYTKKIELKIMKLGFGNTIPSILEIDEQTFEYGKKILKKDFIEILNYFKNEAPNTHVIFTSSFGMYKQKRLGFDELIESVLPN